MGTALERNLGGHLDSKRKIATRVWAPCRKNESAGRLSCMSVLSGRVIGPGGALIGAVVDVRSASGPVRDIAAICDDAGRFRITAVPVGRCTLGVTPPGSAPIVVAFDVEDATETLVEIEISANGPTRVERITRQ